MNSPILSKISAIKNSWVFIILWAVTFAIYVATRQAGWVIDGVGLLYNMKHQSFWDFINTTYSGDQGFYQLLTLPYYIFYKIWGFSPWMWGTLYITMHALNAMLVFSVFRAVLTDSGVKNSSIIALTTAIIFTFSPHISEVLVWRACFHYLLSFLFLLLVIAQTQKYQHTQRGKYILSAILFFSLSVFTNPIFYLTPFFVLILAIYYKLALGYDKSIFRKTILNIFVPLLVLLSAYFVALYMVYGTVRPHKTALSEPLLVYLSKPAKYLFHIIFLGRYFSKEAKDGAYRVLESLPVIILFYALVTGYLLLGISKIKAWGSNSKAIFLFSVCGLMTLFFLIPLAFPMSALWVFYDRYLYYCAPFIYVVAILLVAALVRNKYLLIGLFCAYIDVNLFFTLKVNTSWMEGDAIDKKLIENFPNDESKTVLLLNIPENMNGAAMIGAQRESNLRNMMEVYTGKLPKNTIYDVASYNMVATYNGAHVKVLNDSTISVVLNHVGTWWWYEGHGALSYETPDYKADMKTVGQHYDLILKHPADKYLLLYSVGDTWKKVDMSKINVQQD
ncbi:MAG: hypothetical protein K0Q79_295 [Flavipsychrobacter sp.]|jgi:hypothetical protein|nr:hypothetical protein [Flavipsychrobacter sp.]